MSEHRPVRVRVTGPPRRTHAPGARTGDIDEQTALEVRLSDMRLRVIGDSYVVACLPGKDGHHARIEILQRGDVTDLAQLQVPDEEVYAVSEEPDASPEPVSVEPVTLDPGAGESQTL